MKNVKLGIMALALCCAFSVQAKEKYTIEYAANSPIKSVALKNATLVLEMYDYGKPHGYKRVQTNAQRSFFLNQGEDFEVVGIVGEKKQNARCAGFATPTDQTIKIRCEAY